MLAKTFEVSQDTRISLYLDIIFLKPYFSGWGSVFVSVTNIGIYLLTAKYFNFIFKYLCIFFDYIVTSWKLGAIPGTKEKEKIIIFA